MNKLIKNLIVAAAISVAIIGVYTPATASANGGSWQRDSVGWWYKNSNGSYPKNDWQQIDGKWYYFDGRGYITHSKWERIKDYWYYFNTSGHMTENAWKMIGDKWYYFDNKGHMLSNQWVGDYYVGKDGDMLKNTVTPDNYVVGSDGKWDKRFSRELAEKAKYFDIRKHSKKNSIEHFVLNYKTSYDTAVQFIDTVYPNYNYANNAKEEIKLTMDTIAKCSHYLDICSKSDIIQRLTDTSLRFSLAYTEQDVATAFDELSREMDLTKYFQEQAVKYLRLMHERDVTYMSKSSYKKSLLDHKFTEEEVKKAFDTVKIDFIDQAKKAANYMLGNNEHKPTVSREDLIHGLVNYKGFLKEEAEEGVNRLNYDFKINLRNLIEANFTTANATWAGSISKEFIVDHIVRNDLFVESEVREVLAEYNINYTERARLRAIDILKNGKYSRSNLIKTLTGYWKFTEEEATNAVKNLKHENLID